MPLATAGQTGSATRVLMPQFGKTEVTVSGDCTKKKTSRTGREAEKTQRKQVQPVSKLRCVACKCLCQKNWVRLPVLQGGAEGERFRNPCRYPALTPRCS